MMFSTPRLSRFSVLMNQYDLQSQELFYRSHRMGRSADKSDFHRDFCERSLWLSGLSLCDRLLRARFPEWSRARQAIKLFHAISYKAMIFGTSWALYLQSFAYKALSVVFSGLDQTPVEGWLFRKQEENLVWQEMQSDEFREASERALSSAIKQASNPLNTDCIEGVAPQHRDTNLGTANSLVQIHLENQINAWNSYFNELRPRSWHDSTNDQFPQTNISSFYTVTAALLEKEGFSIFRSPEDTISTALHIAAYTGDRMAICTLTKGQGNDGVSKNRTDPSLRLGLRGIPDSMSDYINNHYDDPLPLLTAHEVALIQKLRVARYVQGCKKGSAESSALEEQCGKFQSICNVLDPISPPLSLEALEYMVQQGLCNQDDASSLYIDSLDKKIHQSPYRLDLYFSKYVGCYGRDLWGAILSFVQGAYSDTVELLSESAEIAASIEDCLEHILDNSQSYSYDCSLLPPRHLYQLIHIAADCNNIGFLKAVHGQYLYMQDEKSRWKFLKDLFNLIKDHISRVSEDLKDLSSETPVTEASLQSSLQKITGLCQLFGKFHSSDNFGIVFQDKEELFDRISSLSPFPYEITDLERPSKLSKATQAQYWHAVFAYFEFVMAKLAYNSEQDQSDKSVTKVMYNKAWAARQRADQEERASKQLLFSHGGDQDDSGMPKQAQQQNCSRAPDSYSHP